MEIRRAQFMGSWYPASEKECQEKIRDFVADAPQVKPEVKRVGGIVPHAGWVYFREDCGPGNRRSGR